MKVLMIAVFSIGMMACNEDNNSSSHSNPASHRTHQDSINNVHSVDASGMTGKSMMSLMQGMMDNMKALQSTGNPDNDFAALMKVHHIGAIEMAQMEAAKGTDPKIKQMAQRMIDDQQREVAEFNSFLSGHPAHEGGDVYFKEAMQIMNSMEMDMDHSGSMDKEFVQMMIPHHQTAIDMSKAYIKTGRHEEKLKTMANNIISSQQQEINELQAWLDKNK